MQHTKGNGSMSKKMKEMHVEEKGVVNHRALLQMIVGAAAVAVVAVGMPVIGAAPRARSVPQMRMSKAVSTSHPRGGHLYMQTNEVKNAIIHYHRSANGALSEVERVATGGAGSGVISPIYHISRPNDF